MKKIFLSAIISLFSADAFSTPFICHVKTDRTIKVYGTLSTDAAFIKIKDEKDVLGIRELKPDRVIQLERSLRKKENKYSFAKYYSDFNAWQDIEISVPKVLNSKYFTAFLTVYGDNGDMMVPGEANTLRCTVADGILVH